MKFKISMFEYCKLILEKLSFSRTLFKKEYKKAFKYLKPDEHAKLKEWVRERFGGNIFSTTGAN